MKRLLWILVLAGCRPDRDPPHFRSRGLPNVAVGETVDLGEGEWHVAEGPEGSTASVTTHGKLASFMADRSGTFTLVDARQRARRIRAGRYDETPLDCGRSGCHSEIAHSIARSPMTFALARVLDHPPDTSEGVGCAVACHATGDPGAHDGGFTDVAAELGVEPSLRDVHDLAALPRALRRLGGVGCLACHGPAALPEADARWSILRTDVCAYCHDAPPRYGHLAGWRASAMARADRDATARSAPGCVTCHTTWGFLARVNASPSDRSESRRPPDEAGTIGIGCAACHDVHAGGERDALLRSIGIDSMFDHVPAHARAKSAACLFCHSPDKSEGAVTASAAAIWAGRGGIDPLTGAALNGPSPHVGVAGGCVGCHADGPANLAKGGGHAFQVGPARCAPCHGGETARASSLELVAEARALWNALEGPPASTPHAVADGAARKPAVARALRDLSLVLEDRACAAHNLPYARMLIGAAKTALAQSSL